MLKIIAVLIVVLACAFPLSLCAATGIAAKPALPVSTENAALVAAINRLAAALENQQRDSHKLESSARLDQAIAYLNFRSRRIESLEKNATTARQIRAAQEDFLNVKENRIQELERQIKNSSKGSAADLELQYETEKTQKNMIRQRITRLDDEIVQLDNQIYELRNEINKLESFVRNNFELP